MPVEPVAATNVRSDLNRLVKVENLYHEDWEEEFRGDPIKIPANGHILLPVLDANKLLSQAKPAATKLPNGQYAKGEKPKALRIVELTKKEREDIEGITEAKAERARLEEERRMKLTCMKCGFQASGEAGLKRHRTSKHPEATNDEE